MDRFDLFFWNGTEEMKRQMDLPGLGPPDTGDLAAKRTQEALYFLTEDLMERDREKYPRRGLF